MNKRNTISTVGFLVFGCFLIIISLQQRKIIQLKSNLLTCIYQKEKNYSYQKKYLRSIELFTVLQNTRIPDNLVLKENSRLEKEVKPCEALSNKSVVVFIPDDCCEECVEEMFKVLEENHNIKQTNKVVLTDIFTEREKERFYSNYNISKLNWDIYHLELAEFLEQLERKILIVQMSDNLLMNNLFLFDDKKSSILLKKYLNKIGV